MKKNNFRKYSLLLIGAFLFALVIYFGGNARADEVLKIGIITAQTGPGAAWGLSVQHGVEMALDEIQNEVVIGGKKYKIETIAYDDKYTGKDGVAAANRLLFSDKVRFIIGSNSSAVAMATKDIITSNKVMWLPGSFAKKLLSPETKNLFRVICTPIEYAPYFAAYISKYLEKTYPGKEKTFAFFSPNDESGWDSEKYQSEALEAQGCKILFKERYERGVKDFVPLLTKVLARNPLVVDCDGSSPGDAGLIIKQARQLGFKGQINYSGGPGFEDILRIAGPEYAEGMLGYSPHNMDTPHYQILEKRHQEKYRSPMNSLLPNYYVATKMLLEALKTAGTTEDLDKVRVSIEKIKFKTEFGGIKWVGEKEYGINHQILISQYVGTIQGGRVKIVASTYTAE
jgi:branched-chain amino acid transport system substrate-binding protein